MKKILTGILCTLMITLTGCGAPKEVPETLAMETITRIVGDRKTAEITGHTPDKELHRDTVAYESTEAFEYGKAVRTGSVTFEYNKENDLWRYIKSEVNDDKKEIYNNYAAKAE